MLSSISTVCSKCSYDLPPQTYYVSRYPTSPTNLVQRKMIFYKFAYICAYLHINTSIVVDSLLSIIIIFSRAAFRTLPGFYSTIYTTCTAIINHSLYFACNVSNIPCLLNPSRKGTLVRSTPSLIVASNLFQNSIWYLKQQGMSQRLFASQHCQKGNSFEILTFNTTTAGISYPTPHST